MKRYRTPRSLLQNNLWHGQCQIIANSTGNTLEAVKYAVKDEIGLYRKDGPIKRYLSSADLDSKEYTILVDKTYQLAAEYGIVLPTPEEWDQMTHEERRNLGINGGM